VVWQALGVLAGAAGRHPRAFAAYVELVLPRALAAHADEAPAVQQAADECLQVRAETLHSFNQPFLARFVPKVVLRE
jgi:hypothetical protein